MIKRGRTDLGKGGSTASRPIFKRWALSTVKKRQWTEGGGEAGKIIDLTKTYQ